MNIQECMGGVLRLDMAPASLRPELATTVLPSASTADLRMLRAQGWMRYGIVAAIVDDRQRIMMLSHRHSAKTPGGALGPLAETAQVGRSQGGVVVETTQETLARALREELGQEDPTKVALRARRTGSWRLNSWPVGTNFGAQRAFAVCPIAHITGEQRQRLQDEFPGTEEIDAVRFMTADQIDEYNNVRPGTRAWLGAVATSLLMELRPDESTGLILPSGVALPQAADILLQEASL